MERTITAVALLAATLIVSPALAGPSSSDEIRLPLINPGALGWSLRQCRQLAFEADVSETRCREYLLQGARQLTRMSDKGIVGAYWAKCYDVNPFFAGQGFDFPGVAQCVEFTRERCSQDTGVENKPAYAQCLRAIDDGAFRIRC